MIHYYFYDDLPLLSIKDLPLSSINMKQVDIVVFLFGIVTQCLVLINDQGICTKEDILQDTTVNLNENSGVRVITNISSLEDCFQLCCQDGNIL